MLEVVAEDTAPPRPYEELLEDIESDISQADKLAQRQAQQEREQALEAARTRVRGLLYLVSRLECPCHHLWTPDPWSTYPWLIYRCHAVDIRHVTAGWLGLKLV